MHHEPKDPRKVLIEELDQLRYTLHDSPEVQQNIPMLDEAFGGPDDTFELDIPILTEPLEDEQGTLSASNHPAPRQAPLSAPAEPGGQAVDPASTSGELEDLLDELIAEYLPILEHQLRKRLRLALGQDSAESD
jgi:hypothetical protein